MDVDMDIDIEWLSRKGCVRRPYRVARAPASDVCARDRAQAS